MSSKQQQEAIGIQNLALHCIAICPPVINRVCCPSLGRITFWQPPFISFPLIPISCCRYLEQSPGRFVGDTSCEKLPVEVCGAGCVVEDGPEECHDKQVDTLIDVPEEVCDLQPQKTCRLVTKLVPSLDPKQECTSVPREVCQMRFTPGSISRKPLRTEWCLDEDAGEQEGGGGYEQPVYQDTGYQDPPIPSYSADLYTADLLEQLKRLRRQMGQRDPNQKVNW